MNSSTFIKTLAAAALAIAGSAQAATTIIDFDAASIAQLSHTSAPFNLTNVYFGGTYVEDGFQFKSSLTAGPITLPSTLFAPDAQNLIYKDAVGATLALAASVGATTTLTKVGGGAFTLNSIDLTRLLAAGGSNRTVTFTGTRLDSSVIQQDISFTGNWATYSFSNFSNLASVKWTESAFVNRDFQVDNLNISAVPEPETYAMLGAGLGLMALLRRRKQS
ncbi:MAG: PEP-CTERM sorting domain-containing protein [Sphingomonadaceae bacterium]